jgi:tRNA (mo5U34)-methyltransferase
MDRSAKLARINARKWYHSIEIEPGLVTPGSLTPEILRANLEHVRMPASLHGLSVLDVGAWDGFYSFEAERRGAARVVAFDVTPADVHGFRDARELIGSRVEYVQGSVYDLSPERVGTFDVVFFFGVLYHCRYPLLALDRLHTVCKQYALLETQYLDNHVILPQGKSVPLRKLNTRPTDIPLYRFYRKDELIRGDFSNWFSPNRKALEESLWSAGFEPQFLAAWHDRIAYKATRVAGVPEYLDRTYEGYVRSQAG